MDHHLLHCNIRSTDGSAWLVSDIIIMRMAGWPYNLIFYCIQLTLSVCKQWNLETNRAVSIHHARETKLPKDRLSATVAPRRSVGPLYGEVLNEVPGGAKTNGLSGHVRPRPRAAKAASLIDPLITQHEIRDRVAERKPRPGCKIE